MHVPLIILSYYEKSHGCLQLRGMESKGELGVCSLCWYLMVLRLNIDMRRLKNFKISYNISMWDPMSSSYMEYTGNRKLEITYIQR